MSTIRRAFPAFFLILVCVLLVRASVLHVPTGTWEAGSSLSSPRTGSTATLMPDGRVLIVGGRNAQGDALASVDIMNADGSVTAGLPMQSARYGHSAILLYDGYVLVAGGHTTGGGVINTAELFDTVNNTWQSLPGTMTDARADFTMSQLQDGDVLVAGGDNGSAAVSSVERFSLFANAFQYVGTLAAARKSHASAVLNDGRVIIAGGTSVSSDGTTIALSSTELYDPASNSISAGPSLNVPRFSHSATTLIDGNVLFAGGNDGSQDLASVEIYDAVAGSITTASSSLASPRSGHTALLLPNNNSVLIAGGTAAGSDLASSELYQSWNNAFVSNPPMSVARNGAASSATGANGVALVAGGSNQSSTDLYGFATVKTDKLDYAPGEVVRINGSGWNPGETVTLSFRESPSTDTPGPFIVTADASGQFVDAEFAPDSSDLNVRFFLTAVGATSGLQAQNSFTDAGLQSVTVVGTQIPNPVAPGSSVTYGTTAANSVNIQYNGNGNACTVTLSLLSGLPAGASASFSANPLNGPGATASLLTVATQNITPPGSYTLTIQAAASANCSGGGNKTATTSLVVVEPTTISLGAAPSPTSTFGQSVVLTATVTQTAGPTTPNAGIVTFKDGATTLGTATPNASGVATLSVSSLTAGSHSLTASYAGTALFGASNSNTVSQTVNQSSTTTTLVRTVGPTPSVFGQSLTFTATVAAVAPGAGTPTGTVTFTDGVTSLGSVALSAGQATLNTSTLVVGSHSITATYNADSNFTGSASSALTQVVNRASTQTTITSDSPDPSAVGQPVAINFTVAAVAPGSGTLTGNVTVSDGLGDNCVATVATGSCSITFNTSGAKTLTATYAGDTNFTGSTSVGASHTVNAAQTTTTITAHTPSPSLVNQAITVNFTLSVTAPGAGIPTGNITVSDGTGDTCVATVAAGTCQLTGTTTGIKTLTASYASDGNFASSTSAGVSHTVGQAPSITSSNSTAFTVGSAGSFTVTATGFPVPTISSSGALPSGVTFSGGAFSGTPASGSAGTYNLVITASNGVGSNDTQNFTLTVNRATAAFSNLPASVSIPFGQASIPVSGHVASANGVRANSPDVVVVTINGASQSIPIQGNSGNFGPVNFDTHLIPASTTPYSISYSFAGDLDLTSTSDSSTTVTINKVTPTATWANPADITYGTALSSTQLNATFTAVVNGSTVAIPGVATYTPPSGTVLNAGNAQTLAVSFVPTDSTDYNNASKNVAINVLRAATSILIGAPSVTVPSNGTVTLTVSSAGGTPTGSVSLSVDGGAAQTQPLNVSGVATFTITNPVAGTHTLSANYVGQGNFAASTATGSLQVNYPAPTLTSLVPTSGNLNTTLNVVLSGGGFFASATTVSFGADITVNSVAVNTQSQLTANITIPQNAAIGAHNVSVTNPTPGGGTATLIGVFTVNNPATTTLVNSSLPISTYGQSVTFTASVSSVSGTPTGSVSFYDGANCATGTLFGTSALNSGSASASTAALSGGSHNIAACYTPGVGSIYLASAGSVLQQVNQATPTVSFTGAPASAIFGAQFTVVATSNSTAIPAITASGACSNIGSLVTMTSGTGTCSMQATWAADTNYLGATLNQSTTAQLAPVAITVPDTTVIFDGTPKSILPSVTPNIPPVVTYSGISPTVYATSETAPTDPGTYLETATVSNTNYFGTGSGTLTISKKDPALNLVLLTGMPEPSPYGTSVYFELTTASGPCPTGSVQFFVDSESTPRSTVTLTNAPCNVQPIEFRIANLDSGNHTVHAVYDGDTYYLSQTSGSVPHEVVATGTAVLLASDATSVFVGDTVTFTATVSPSIALDGSAIQPSGSVNFKEGANVLGTASVVGNIATFQTTFAAGSHSITADFVSDNGDYNGSSSPVNVETVNKIAPTITWPTPGDIVYGTKLSSVQLNASAKDAHNGNIAISGSFEYTPAVDTLLAVGSRNLSVTFTPDDSSTYTTQTASVTINVTAATVTVTPDPASRDYGDDNPAFMPEYEGFITGETSEVLSSPATCSSNASKTSDVGQYDITCSGAVAANYTFSYVVGQLKVLPAELIVTADDATRAYGDNNPSFTGSIVGIRNNDNITATYATTATSSSPVATYAIVPTLVDPDTKLSNYHVTSNSGAFKITKRNASVTPDTSGKTYGDTDPALSGTLTNFVAADGVSAVYSRSAGESVATYTISAVLSPASVLSNYNITYNTANFVITKRDASVTPNASGKTYGDTDPALTGTLTNFVAADGVTATYSRTTGETVATYTISATLSPAGVLNNYNITYNTANFVITKRDASVTPNASGKTYGDTDPALTGSLTNFVAGDGVSAVYSRTAGETVATYTISAALSPTAALSNYNITYNTANFVIGKRNATVTPNGLGKTYGDNDPALTGTLTNFVAADGVSAVYSRSAGESVATYTISAVLSPASVLSNYNITYNTANFVITKRDASVTPNASGKTYGDTDPALSGTLTNFVAADGVSATYSRTAGETVATYTISATLSPAGVLNNYNITYNTANFVIGKRNATVTPNGLGKTYGDNDPALTGSLTNFVAGDGVSAVYSRTAGETVATYTISATLSPASVLSNYNITYNTANFVINKALLSVVVANKSMTINGQMPPLTGTISGIKFGDPISANYSTTANGTVVGSFPISAALVDPSNKLPNYTVNIQSGSLTVSYQTGGMCAGSSGHSILQPVNADGTSTFKQGSTVPAKFRVCDANGVSIGIPGVVTSFNLVAIINGTITTTVDEDVVSTNNDTAFRWDPSAQQWIFNVSTKPLSVHSTYIYQIGLNDGSVIRFQFGLPK